MTTKQHAGPRKTTIGNKQCFLQAQHRQQKRVATSNSDATYLRAEIQEQEL
jgi:hypothetical protein